MYPPLKIENLYCKFIIKMVVKQLQVPQSMKSYKQWYKFNVFKCTQYKINKLTFATEEALTCKEMIIVTCLYYE